MSESRRGIPRRAFVKSAVAIGGAAALSACLDREGVDLPQGPEDPSSLPERQHAWNEYLSRDDHGNAVAPRHHAVLLLEYAGEGTPAAAERGTLEDAFRSLERAYPRSNEGLLFTVGYSPRYFSRFDASLPASVDLPEPEALAPFEDPEPDRPDAVVHLASDYGQVVLGAEEALLGEREDLNGVEIAGLDGALERAERRTGFVGAGLPAENQAVDGIPEGEPVDEDAPLYMGFKSGFEKNQASEDRVTIREGPFAGGTTQHLSKIRLRLDQWYQQDDRFQRVGKMFCPAHAESGRVEGVGENLEDGSDMGECSEPDEAARHHGLVGHSQKMVSARERVAGDQQDDAPVILRRDFDSTDDGEAGLHFLAVHRTVSDFVDTRRAMNGTDVAEASAVGQRTNNGILQYMKVRRRGNYLLPPRSHRSLPTPRP
jgi:hypothetical protein